MKKVVLCLVSLGIFYTMASYMVPRRLGVAPLVYAHIYDKVEIPVFGMIPYPFPQVFILQELGRRPVHNFSDAEAKLLLPSTILRFEDPELDERPAYQVKRESLAEMMVAKGFDINVSTVRGCNAVEVANFIGDTRAAAFLVSAGATDRVSGTCSLGNSELP